MASISADWTDRIVLAREPAFSLGALEVVPALRQLSRGGISRSLEPRVMQVLVLLARADGAIVSRDTLIERCWDGRIVGDNAINRVISLLRQLSDGLGKGCFEIETVVKVGYRLVEPRSAEAPAAPAPQAAAHGIDRRRAALGLAVAGMAAATGTGLYLRAGSARSRARALYSAGLELQRQGRPERLAQAIDYFRQATEADPSFADAWGAMALARVNRIGHANQHDAAISATQARKAIDRALAIDPHNRDATIARILLKPYFRHWAEVEREVRLAKARFPRESLLSEVEAEILCQAGRWREAVTVARTLAAAEPLDAWHQQLLGNALWATGEIEWARATLERAARQSPDDGELWLARFNLLAMGGWAQEALALVGDESNWPSAYLPMTHEVALSCAGALATRHPTDVDEAIGKLVEARRAGKVASLMSIPYLTLLGAVDIAFAQCADYYFGRRDAQTGVRTPPPPIEERWTDFLFARPTARLRADPRFPALIGAIGLDAYWRSTGSKPDYLRVVPA